MWHAMTKLERGANKEMCINAVLVMTASHQAATLQLHGNCMATHDMSHCMQHVAGGETTQTSCCYIEQCCPYVQ